MNTSRSILSRLIRSAIAVSLFFTAFSGNLLAQDGWTVGNRLIIQGGLSSPVANFGAIPSTLQDLIPADGKTPLGGANLGFTVGLTDVFRFTPNFALSVSLDANYLSYNNDEASRQLKNAVLNVSLGGASLAPLSSLLGLTTSYNAQAYINGTLTGGLRYDLPIIAGLLNLYANAQAGLFYGILPQSEAKLGLSIPFTAINVNSTINRPQATATAFAYKVGAGVLIGDRINIGLNYLASTPSYITETSINTQTSGITGSVSVPGLGQLSTQSIANAIAQAIPTTNARYDFPFSVLQLTVGYAF